MGRRARSPPHGPDKPGGRIFCYFDGNDAVAVWTHKRLGQPTHRDVLMIAREGGSDHAGLTRWWLSRPPPRRQGGLEKAGTERGKGRASCPSACLFHPCDTDGHCLRFATK